MKFARPLATALCLAAICFALFAVPAHADDPARFDLTGPKVSVHVTRNGKTLPIAQVPNLQAGDRIWLHADLPRDQANHFLLVLAFLRGTTNEPPDNWFTKIETWEKKAEAGTTVTVPFGAQQALLFLAPETGGDFDSLRSTVKQKPGQFIRADADLNEASFEQQRIERYLASMKTVSPDDSKAIQDRSTKLSAALGLKAKDDCFKQPVNQQVSCLTQASAPVILGDQQGQNLAQALSNNGAGDLVNQASYTQAAGTGAYSAYVGAIVDVVRLVGNLRSSPDYQYIPGLTFPDGETLNLKLNAPPSFKKPKTVIVVGLPSVQQNTLPQLRAQSPNQVACLLEPQMTLPVTGAPLVFSTSFAHNLSLHLDNGKDIPLKPDAIRGGLVAQNDFKPAGGGDKLITGTIHGNWGFDAFEGPKLKLQQTDSNSFKIIDDGTPIAGQDKKLALQADSIGCVQTVTLTGSNDLKKNLDFKPAEGDKAQTTLDLTVPLKDAKPGSYALLVQQYGKSAPDRVALTAYNGAIHFDNVKVHAGDTTALLTGDGTDQVASVQIAGQDFMPAGKGGDANTLQLSAKAAVTPSEGAEATVKLKDGRTLPVKIDAEAARPALKLLSMRYDAAPQAGSLPITLSGKDEIPLRGKLTFVLHSEKPFDRGQRVEVATANGGSHTDLSLADSSLVLQDEHTAIATLDPQKSFGDSAFGKLQLRPVSADGTTGSWTPLGTLVRLPQITAVQCAGSSTLPTSSTPASSTAANTTTSATPGAATASTTCNVQGSRLFLVQAFSASSDFSTPAELPTGYSDSTFPVPTPQDGSTLYLKLRDDPNSVASLKLPTPVQPSAASATPQPPAASTPTPATPQAPAAPATPQAPASQLPATAPTHTPAPAPNAQQQPTAPQPMTP